MSYLIFLAILYWVFRRLRVMRNEMPLPQPRRPKKAESNYQSPRDDRPLRGPWDDDAPLSGPWSIPEPEIDSGTVVSAEGNVTAEKHNYDWNRDEWTPVPDTQRKRELEKKREVIPHCEGYSEYPPSPLVAAAAQNDPWTIRRPGSGGGNGSAEVNTALDKLLRDRGNLAAGIIIGEALARRGGLRRR